MSVACIVSAKDPDGSCSSCNCRFNNIQVLDQIIESKIANGDQHCMQYIYIDLYMLMTFYFLFSSHWSYIHKVGEEYLSTN